MTGKFIQGKENKRESWKNDVYPLLFKSLQHSTFSKLVNKAFPKAVFDEKEIEYCLNLIQGTLRYREKNRPSTVQIQGHAFVSNFSNRKDLFEPDFMWRKFLSPSSSFEESISLKNDLLSLGEYKNVVIKSEDNFDVEAHLQNIIEKAPKFNQGFPCSSKTSGEDISTVIQDVIDVGEQIKNLSSRNKPLAVVDGSGDNDGIAEMRKNEALDDSKKNTNGKKTLRLWCSQIWKRIRNGFLRSCHQKMK